LAPDRERDALLPSTKDVSPALMIHHRENTEITDTISLSPELKNQLNNQVQEYLRSPEFTDFASRVLASCLQEKLELSRKESYSNAFYMGAGLSAFAGAIGYLYFGGFLGSLSIIAAAGPFLMSILGLMRLRK